MVFKKKSKDDSRRLISGKRSDFISKEPGKVKLPKRLSSIFKKKKDNAIPEVVEIDTDTPPVTPEKPGKEDSMGVTLVSTPYIAPEQAHEEQSYSATTLSDFSMSVQRPRILAASKQANSEVFQPIQEPEEEQAFENGATSASDQTATTKQESDDGTLFHISGKACTPDAIVSNFFGFIDETCRSIKKSSKGSPKTKPFPSDLKRPDWGTAPSLEDDCEAENPFAPPNIKDAAATFHQVDSYEKRQSDHDKDTNTSANARTDYETLPNKPTHEDFELILNPSSLRGSNKTPKRKALSWMRNRSLIEEEKKIDHEKAIVGTHEKSAQKLPPFVKRLTKRNMALSGRETEAQDLVEELMTEGELLGAEYVEEDEEQLNASRITHASSEIDEALKATEIEVHEIVDGEPLKKGSPVRDGRIRSWSHLTKVLARRREDKDGKGKLGHGEDITRTNSSPVRLLSDPVPPVNMWKSAEDPTTGRTYYYHRVTRKTTWTKPPNFDSLNQQEMEFNKSVRPETNKASSFKFEAESGLAVPSSILISGDAQVPAGQQKKIDAGDRSAVSGEFSSILKKTSSRDFDPDVWEKKEEITRLLSKMAPPDGDSVVKVMNQYEGREDELLSQLRDLVKSQPFDEPLLRATPSFASSENAGSEPDLLTSRVASGPVIHGRTRTANTAKSGISNKTERTERIKNTGKAGVFESIKESEELFSDESLSSNNESEPKDPPIENTPQAVESTLPPKKSERIRDLRVEEFTSSRWGLKLENYNEQANMSPRRQPPKRRTQITRAGESEAQCNTTFAEESYSGDNEETDNETFTDTVSGLSQSDYEFQHHKDNFNQARRKALDEAIKRKDWELAASVTDNLRITHSRDNSDSRHVAISEWTQSELDKFISENDWDAVASYIAHMRDTNGKSKVRRGKASDHDSSIQKRFGAKSQLQHSEEERSISSWESDSLWESDDASSASSAVFDARNPRYARKEFAC